jgi:aldose 1-epimerase
VVFSVTYALTADSLHVSMEAVTTRPTPVNMANHAYYNLAGHGAGADQLYEHRNSSLASDKKELTFHFPS